MTFDCFSFEDRCWFIGNLQGFKENHYFWNLVKEIIKDISWSDRAFFKCF